VRVEGKEIEILGDAVAEVPGESSSTREPEALEIDRLSQSGCCDGGGRKHARP
jgi:hypothetical protein